MSINVEVTPNVAYIESFKDWEPNLIEALSVAQRENVHSAMLSYLLDDQRLDMAARIVLLRALVPSLPVDEEIAGIDAQTEWNDIDILVRLSFTDGTHRRVAIENKLKSTEHGDQLDRYDHHLHQLNDPVLGKVFLTLTGEQPRKGKGWHAASYEDLLRGLTSASQAGVDHEPLRMYVSTVKRLVAACALVRSSEHHATQVFSKRSEDLAAADGFERFILRGRTGTILQQVWMRSVRDLMLNRSEAAGWQPSVGETRGAALLDIARDVERGECRVWVGIQIQYQNIKVFAHPVEPNDDSARAAAVVEDVLGEIKTALSILGKPTTGKFRSFPKGGRAPAGRSPAAWASAAIECLSGLEPLLVVAR